MTTRDAGIAAALLPRDPLAPLAWLIVPLPVWWYLGLANLGWFIAAVPMAISLVSWRRWRLPPGFGWWLAFLLWLVLSVSMLPVNPAGTVAEGAGARVVPVLFRFAEYGSATVMMLWALNVDPVRVPAARLARLLSLMLVWTVAGGLLGVIAPDFQVTSLMERLLPGGLLTNAYVLALVHPAAAQIQDVIGTGNGRPSAPFAYTNSWGNALGLLIPWAVAAAVLARTHAARTRWTVLVLAALVPTVLSLNRGLWIGLVIVIGFAVVRLLLTGRELLGIACLGLAACVLVLVAVSPLGAVAEQRQTGDAPSDDIRGFSISRALQLGDESPVLGYGGTRAQAGSQDTIAVGKSPTCSNCGNLPIGTNGQLWFVIVGQGFLGAFFYLMFHLVLLRRFLASRNVLATAGAATMVIALWFSVVYDRTGPTGCLEFLAIGLAAKALLESARAESPAEVVDRPDLRTTDAAP
ncbi:O-antigen ligase family protein [Nocardioides sp. URHA0020]|uniref:O-antigen ligase family protein n=1 Tax=Nocardioides sp. URHA0020 TaxID=1380392 RepID=UPI0018CC32B3|nr:O-antigen ligase family protein [Nocardioides sp. URHA0020]